MENTQDSGGVHRSLLGYDEEEDVASDYESNTSRGALPAMVESRRDDLEIDAMEAATLKARRLNALIAGKDATRLEQHTSPGPSGMSVVSLSSIEGIMTPTSSPSEREYAEAGSHASWTPKSNCGHSLGYRGSQPS